MKHQKQIKKLLAKKIVEKMAGRNITERTFDKEDMQGFPLSWYTCKQIVDNPNYIPKNQNKIAACLDYFGVDNTKNEFGFIELVKP